MGCFRGSSCSFRHEGGATKPLREDPSPLADPAAAALAAAVDNIVISASNPYANVTAAANGALPCRFFASPLGCRNGPQCQFAHAAPMAMMPQFAVDEQHAIAMYYQQQTGAAGLAPLPPVMPPMMLSDPPPPPLPTRMHGLQLPPPPGPQNGGHSPPAGSDGFSSVQPAGTPRRALKIQANPSKTGNYEVISEVLPVLTREIEGPVRYVVSWLVGCCFHLVESNEEIVPTDSCARLSISLCVFVCGGATPVLCD